MFSAEEAKKITAEQNLKLIEAMIKAESQNGKYYLKTAMEITDPEIKLLEENGYDICREDNVFVICWNT